jgi:hypothetical protein
VKKSLGFYDRGGDDPADAKAEQDSKAPASDYLPEYVLEVESSDRKRAILFTTQAGKVIRVSTGMKPMVLEPEPCQ